jgi:hypothetical protein
MLVRYLDERRPSLDYSSLITWAGILAGQFWADIEQHNPEIETLRLPREIVEAWKQRLHFKADRNGVQLPHEDRLRVLAFVRTFYRDLQEWALLPYVWVGFHDRIGRTPCTVYVSELPSTGTIMDGTACALQDYCVTFSGSRTR